MASISWENALVLQTSFLGDTVLTLPLLAEIKRRFPVKKLTLLCNPLGKELLQGHPAIDEIIVDDKRGADSGLGGLLRQAALLKTRAFTLALTPHKSMRTALMLYFAGIPCRVGFRQSRGWFLFHRRVVRDLRRHDVERNLSLLEAFDLPIEECELGIDLPVRPNVEESVDRLLRSLGVSSNRLIIGVNPGSVWATKRWSPASFARLITLLAQRYDCQVLLFGGPEDAAVVAKIQESCAVPTIDLVGRTGLGELPAVISRCQVFVTNDSGPMHVAVARKVSTVAIFCATTPAQGFFPYSANAIVIEKALDCRPCASHGGRRCPLGTEDCMRLIHPEQVLRAVEKLLRLQEKAPVTPANPYQPEFVTI
jgi:heptosyltransferase-2